MTAPLPSAELRARILAKTREAPSPTRAEVSKKRIPLVLGALVPAIVVVALLGLGPKGRPVELALLVSFGWAAVAMATTSLALGSRSPLGPSRPVLGLLAASAPILQLSISALGMALFPDTWSGVLGPKNHATCMMLSAFMGAAPLGAMLFHLRGLDPVSPHVRGAALGATAGAWAGTGAMLVCPHHGAIHVLVGHVLPVVLFTLAGLVVGGRVLALQARANAR